jgi:hypothetical protein
MFIRPFQRQSVASTVQAVRLFHGSGWRPGNQAERAREIATQIEEAQCMAHRAIWKTAVRQQNARFRAKYAGFPPLQEQYCPDRELNYDGCSELMSIYRNDPWGMLVQTGRRRTQSLSRSLEATTKASSPQRRCVSSPWGQSSPSFEDEHDSGYSTDNYATPNETSSAVDHNASESRIVTDS